MKRSYYRKSQRPTLGKSLLKLFLGVLIFGAPVLVLLLIFKPFVSQQVAEERPAVQIDYSLPLGYQRKDVTEIVKKMSDDPEYLFYFYSIGKDDIVKATYDVFEILDRARNRDALKSEIDSLQKKTQSLATMFYHLEYTDDYVDDPTAFPELQKVLKTFLYEEFKLAILGVSYKGTYDENFYFQWDRTSRLAARKLHGILLKRRRAAKK
ncbi:MAG: hypothetical protein KC900_11755 [Candidatus Omnitrophica bacterium]|nr:hypothetical protein [Candidatus Omnitrophota bacterium]